MTTVTQGQDMPYNATSNRTSPNTDQVFTVVFPALYTLLFVTGLLLNSLAAWVFFQLRGRRSTFVMYLRNMVTADLLMTLTFPPSILSEARLGPWWLPASVCRYTAVLFYASMYASILFLGLVALDRYLKIVQPFGGSFGSWLYSYSFTRAVSVSVWLAVGILSLPNVVLTNLAARPETARNCTGLKSDLGLRWHGAVAYINVGVFLVVLGTLVVCYLSIYMHVRRSTAQFVVGGGEGKKERAGQNISLVLVVFFVCFVPYHLWRIPFTLSQTDRHFSQGVEELLLYGKKATLFLASCNVCLDPVLYFFMCKSFRLRLATGLGLRRTSFRDTSISKRGTQVRRFREYSPT